MRVLLFGVVAALATKLRGERDLTIYNFDDYLREFGKTYSKEEAATREAIFQTNLKTIREHNSKPQKTWFMTINEFADWTPVEFKTMRLGSLPLFDDSSFVGVHESVGLNSYPDRLDWREQEGVVTPVKNQGSCGSCWAFSSIETLESHYAIATGDPAPRLSAQQLVDCSPNPQHCGGTGGCQGSIQTLAFNYTATAGMAGEADYPYVGSTGSCQQSKINACVSNKGYVKVKVNDYTSHMDALQKGPVAISLAAMSLQSYGGGVLNQCDCDMDHAVQLVGYGTDGGKDYWLVRNSWGGSWGEKGYVRIQRFGEGNEPTCVDNTPQDGEACAGDTSPRTYAGLCGLLGSSSYPTEVGKIGDGCPKPPPGCGFADCGGCSGFCNGHGSMNCNSGSGGLHCKCGDGTSCDGEGLPWAHVLV